MGVTVSVDTGGTFTDGYFTRSGKSTRVKVDTTPHDFAECFRECLTEGAKAMGYPSLKALLLETDALRFSSTLGTNSIIQRSGPRIGLIVSTGASESLYGAGTPALYDLFLRRELVIELAHDAADTDVRRAISQLLIGGARILVVSLADGEGLHAREKWVEDLVREDYPRHYLGAVPCLLSSELTQLASADTRTATAVINAYLHSDMVKVLYRADEDVRSEGYGRPLLIAHASGGMARVAKTRAIETYNSGPVGGVYGIQRMAELYGIRNVLGIDIGGTSTDVSLLVDRNFEIDAEPTIAGITVSTPMLRIQALGSGGGSIARLVDQRLTVGPESAGASPGPASYGLGGTSPTATDAEVLLGTINPTHFLGGRKKLDVERARSAISKLDESAASEVTAWRIHQQLATQVAEEIRSSMAAAGLKSSEVDMFAFGGAAGLYAVDVAEALGVSRVWSFDSAAVFSAFGISSMDVSHLYEIVTGPQAAATVESLMERARLDVLGEGLDPELIEFSIEMDTEVGLVRAPCQLTALPTQILHAGTRARLRSTSRISAADVAEREGAGSGESVGRTTYRAGEELATTVITRDQMQVGSTIAGPAIVESDDTVLVIPPGWFATTDKYATVTVTKEEK